MKISHHVYNYWTYSGATQQAIKLAVIMRKKEDVKSVFINSEKNNLHFFKITVDGDATVIDLPSKPFYKALSVFWLLVFSNYKADVYHFHGFHLMEMFFGCVFKKTIVYKCTLEKSDDLKAIFSRKFKFLNKWIIKRVDKINSLNNKIYNINKNFVAENNLTIIPNGVDVDVDVDENIQARKLFLFAGAIVPRKQPLEVIKHYIKNYSNTGYPLILAGPCDNNLKEFDIEYYNQCVELAASLPSNQIQFVGNKTKEDIHKLYTRAIGLIFFSLREGTPNVVLEAMASNCPIIFSQNDEVITWLLGEQLTKKLSLSCFDKGLIEMDCLLNVIESKQLLKRSENFSMDKTALLTLELYHSLRLGQ